MLDTLKIIAERLQGFENLDSATKHQTVKVLKDFAVLEGAPKTVPASMCPVTFSAIHRSCELKSCKFWVEHNWTKNCALAFLLNQEKKDKLTVEQVSLLYKKSPQRVDSIYKRSFKIMQRHYLKDLLRDRQVPRFTFLPGFCVYCQSKLLEEDLNDPGLCLGEGLGYCSLDCKKSHPPSYFEIERFFEAEFLRIIEVGTEVFHLFALEDLLGFQPNVLRNRLEKMRDGKL